MTKATKLPTHGHNGERYDEGEQMALVVNLIRAEHRKQPPHTDNVVMGGLYTFNDHRDHEVMYHFRHPGKGFVGVYQEELFFDGVYIGNPQSRAASHYTDAEGNVQPGYTKPDFFGWTNYEKPF